MGKPPSDLDRTQRRPAGEPVRPRKDERLERSGDDVTAPPRARDRVPQPPEDTDRTALRPDPDARSKPSRPARPIPQEPDDGTTAAPTSRPARAAAPRAPNARPAAARPRAAGPVGAVPASPRAEKTATQIVKDRVARDWRWTAATMGGAVLCGVVGIALIGNSHLFTGAAVLVAMIPLSLAALFVRRAPCPKCSKPIIVMGIEECENCHSFIFLKDETLHLVESGFVADIATFPLKVPLPIVPRLTFPEDGRCCVCGEAAGGNEVLDIQDTRVVVAHCGNCTQGVMWDLSLGTDAVTMVTLKFRSFDYYNALREANVGHLREGMWR